VISTREVIDARKVVQEVYIDEKIGRYIVDIVFATRFPDQYGLPNLKEMIGVGASPRASINLAARFTGLRVHQPAGLRDPGGYPGGMPRCLAPSRGTYLRGGSETTSRPMRS